MLSEALKRAQKKYNQKGRKLNEMKKIGAMNSATELEAYFKNKNEYHNKYYHNKVVYKNYLLKLEHKKKLKPKKHIFR